MQSAMEGGTAMLRRTFCQTALAAGIAAAVGHSETFAAPASSSHAASDIAAITGNGREVWIGKADVHELSESLEGKLLLPGNNRYESARRM